MHYFEFMMHLFILSAESVLMDVFLLFVVSVKAQRTILILWHIKFFVICLFIQVYHINVCAHVYV